MKYICEKKIEIHFEKYSNLAEPKPNFTRSSWWILDEMGPDELVFNVRDIQYCTRHFNPSFIPLAAATNNLQGCSCIRI